MLTLRGEERVALSLAALAAYWTEYLPWNPYRKGYFDELWARRTDGTSLFTPEGSPRHGSGQELAGSGARGAHPTGGGDRFGALSWFNRLETGGCRLEGVTASAMIATNH
jgi:hypothetical protein